MVQKHSWTDERGAYVVSISLFLDLKKEKKLLWKTTITTSQIQKPLQTHPQTHTLLLFHLSKLVINHILLHYLQG